MDPPAITRKLFDTASPPSRLMQPKVNVSTTDSPAKKLFGTHESSFSHLLIPTVNAKNQQTETADAKTARATLTPTKRRPVDTPLPRPAVPVTAVPSSRLMKPTANASVKFFWGHR